MSTTPVGLVGLANDTSFIDFFKRELKDIKFTETVSIIISHYEQEDLLKKCLSFLEQQTYPLDLIEIIIADDGSSNSFIIQDIAESFRATFKNIRVVTQQDLGFRLSAVRNLGLDSARHDYIIMLDVDMIPQKDLVREHIAVTRISKSTISIGFRKDYSTLEDLKKDHIEASDLDWRFKRLDSQGFDSFKFTNTPFKLCSGGNIAAHRDVFKDCKFDESFQEWGGEDNEWAYRKTKQGAYFYPNIYANCWHLIDPTYAKKERPKTSTYQDLCPMASPQNVLSKTLKNPYVSFWITSLNKCEFIEQAVYSLLDFNLSNEIVIVDNGSSDGSIEIIKELARKFEHIKVFYEPQKGPYFAYEKALNMCKGDLLIQVDADDSVLHKPLETFITRIFESPQGLFYGLTQVCDLQMTPIEKGVWVPKELDSRVFNLTKGMSVRSPRILRRRDLSRAPLRTEYDAAVDYELYSKVLLVTKPLRENTIMYLYRAFTENSITRNLKDSQLANSKKIVLQSVESLKPFGAYVGHLGLNPNLITEEMIARMVSACGYTD